MISNKKLKISIHLDQRGKKLYRSGVVRTCDRKSTLGSVVPLAMFYLGDQVCGLLQSRLSEVSNTWTISSSQTHSPIVPSQQLVTSASYLLICTLIVNCCIEGVGGRLFVFFAHCWNKSLFFWCRRNFGVLTDRVSELLDCPQPLYVDGQSKCCCESPPVHRSLLARLVCLFVVVVVVVFVFKINGIGD